ncbi:MAG: ABC transporter permease [Candidatus Acidiferrales bacterium]
MQWPAKPGLNFAARFRSWWQATFRRSRMEREMDAELRFHLESYAEELIRNGVLPKEAQRRARLEFGGLDRTKEECRDARTAGWAESLIFDLRYGVRVLRKSPGFAVLSILTVALGIGATTAVFSLVNAVLLRDLPYRDPQQIDFLFEPVLHIPGVPLEAWGPMNADFYDWKQQNHSFGTLALFSVDRLNLSVDDNAIRVGGSRVTSEFFQVLGIAPQLGRVVGPEDDQPGKGQVVVISHALWQSHFGTDRGVLGKELSLTGRPYRVIGVMPAGFSFPHGAENLDTVGRVTDVWVPWAMTPQEKLSRVDGAGNAIGRLRPGVSLSQAQAEISTITARFDSLHPPVFQGSTAVVRPLEAVVTGGSRRALLIFMGAVVLVLLVACSNVASLILARATSRAQEMNVRAALGASRTRLIRQLLAESLCLSGSGGLLGVLIAFIAIRFLILINPGNIPRLEEISIDWSVLLFTIGVSLATGFLFGLFPALTVSRGQLNDVLKAAGNRSVKGRASALHGGLMVTEVALAVVLLAGSGLLIRSFMKLQGVDKGFAAQSTVTMNIQLDPRYSQPERQTAFFRNVIDRTSALPGVEAAAAINYLPLGGGESITLLTVEGYPFDQKIFFEDRAVSPRYFAAMGIPLLQGRDFTDDDSGGHPRAAIVSRSFARKYFPGQSALGKRFRDGGDNSPAAWCTIVGVVGDVRYWKLDTPPPMQIYTPLWGTSPGSASVVARTNLPPDNVASNIRATVHDLDPSLVATDLRTMNQLISKASAERRFQTLLLTIFGGVALFLSLVGLYGLMAYSVQQRTAEIGIRMALGAQAGDVLRLVLKQGANLALAGIALGVAGAWCLTRLMTSLLFEVKPTDAPTFFGVALSFCLVALAACYVPARRATRLDPMVALRYE